MSYINKFEQYNIFFTQICTIFLSAFAEANLQIAKPIIHLSRSAPIKYIRTKTCKIVEICGRYR